MKEADEKLRQASNRTFARIVAALPTDLAARLGHTPPAVADPKEELLAAVAAGNWGRVAELAARIEGQLSAG